jgi:hypothetical protein
MKKQKVLKIWNGRGHGKFQKGHIYVAAYSQKQAAELVGTACGLGYPLGVSEIRNYYSFDCWGNDMQGIVPTEPCVYASEKHFGKPFRVI